MMKSGIFSECFEPTINGVVISIKTFRSELTKMGHEVFVIAPATKDKNYHNDDEKIIRVPSISLPGKNYYPLGIPYFSHLSKKLAPLNLDIIHVQHLFGMGRAGRKVARNLNLPLVYTYHTLLTEYAHYVPFFKGITKKVLIKLSRDFANSADLVITPTSQIRDLLRSYGVKSRIEPVPTGIFLENYQKLSSDELKKEFKINPDEKVLLNVGRLAPEKNLSFLLQAFKKIHSEFPKCHLLIVGGGEEEKRYQLEVENLGLKENVTMTGYLEHEKTNHIFAEADIFVMPSLTETQGIVVAEAFAGGIPCVAVNKFGPSEIVQDGKSGYLTTPGDVDKFAQKTLKLLKDDQLREQMSKNAIIRAQDFSATKTAQKLATLYQELITAKSK